jgi:HEAT repeat protein
MEKQKAMSPEAIVREIRALEECSDLGQRNRMALALAETGDHRVGEALIRLIQKSD